ncbi:MAG: hypothetical protein E6423_02220 [Clostridium sp.]|nr:hypothetical protein [Clostridium sp.]
MMKKSINIISIEGKSLINATKKYGEYKTTIVKEGKEINLLPNLLKGSLPYSLESIYLDGLTEGKEIHSYKRDKQYTKAIINITFNNKYVAKVKEDRDLSTKEIREELYNNGFTLDGCRYVLYKRSGSKARNGQVLFIKQKYFEDMMSWSRLGLTFTKGISKEDSEEVDIASLKAYESLTLSSIESTIEINPNSILLVGDIDSKFKELASVTELVGGELITTTKEIELSNSIFDGEGLMDESLFTGALEGKSMALLRARFLKSCVFNTKIQEFFKDNNITEVRDMFGKVHNAEDIKIITTPNSLKFLKFAYKVGKGTKEEAYNYWKANVGTTFGICKWDKGTHFENGYNQLSYQMINSIEFTKEEIKDLAKEELDYVYLLKSDLEVFKRHISLQEDSCSRDLMLNLLAINNKVANTKMFKEFRRNNIKSYINRLRQGKIKIANTDYCTILGNPVELLYHAIGRLESDNNETIKYMDGKNEVYCRAYRDGEELCGFRNPHVCSGNVLYVKNKWREEYKYFNLSNNIVIVNAIGFGIQDRIQGCDYDSDTVLLTNNKILVSKAKESTKYPTPVNRVTADKTKRYYNNADMADVDYAISVNLIGDIINTSQKLNSYYWDLKFNNKEAIGKEKEILDKDLDELYSLISLCSSLSQIEIDKAKKFYDIDMSEILDNIKSSKYVYRDTQKKEIKPYFFKFQGTNKTKKMRDNSKLVYQNLNTAMDYLEEIIDSIPRSKSSKNVNICELLVEKNSRKSNRKQMVEIKQKVKELNEKIKHIMALEDMNKREKIMIIEELKEDLVEELKDKKIIVETVIALVKQAYKDGVKDNNENSEYGLLLVSLLFKSHPDVVLEAFKDGVDNVKWLEECASGEIVIWGKKYGKR